MHNKSREKIGSTPIHQRLTPSLACSQQWVLVVYLHYGIIGDTTPYQMCLVIQAACKETALWILSNLHLNNNADLPSRDLLSFEKLNKAQPLLHRLRENNQNTYIPHKQLAVDEAMILFKSRSLIKEIIVTNTSQLD